MDIEKLLNSTEGKKLLELASLEKPVSGGVDLSRAKEIKVTSPKGTQITAQFNPEYHWVPCHGLYHQPGDWGNLPEGEVFTCPWKLDGVLVVDVLGDFF